MRIFLYVYINIFSICVNICIELSRGDSFQKKNNIATKNKRRKKIRVIDVQIQQIHMIMRKKKLKKKKGLNSIFKINN